MFPDNSLKRPIGLSRVKNKYISSVLRYNFPFLLQRMRSLLLPDEHVMNEVNEREGVSRKALDIK